MKVGCKRVFISSTCFHDNHLAVLCNIFLSVMFMCPYDDVICFYICLKKIMNICMCVLTDLIMFWIKIKVLAIDWYCFISLPF